MRCKLPLTCAGVPAQLAAAAAAQQWSVAQLQASVSARQQPRLLAAQTPAAWHLELHSAEQLLARLLSAKLDGEFWDILCKGDADLAVWQGAMQVSMPSQHTACDRTKLARTKARQLQ